jgi:hypothetical protein
MMLSYHFKFIKTTWGISILLAAEDTEFVNNFDCDQITDRIYLQKIPSSFKLLDRETEYLKQAIFKMGHLIHGKLLPDQKIVINIVQLDFHLTDYQEEGLYCAMIGWISKRFGIAPQPVEIIYNKLINRYDFKFL